MFGHDVARDDVLKVLEIDTVSVGSRPSARSTFWGSTKGISRLDFVCMLMWLERVGVAVDPMPWVAALRPAIVNQNYIDARELAIYWYPRERGKFKELYLEASRVPGVDAGNHMRRKWVTATGYRVDAMVYENGAVTSMTVKRPSKGSVLQAPSAAIRKPLPSRLGAGAP